MPQLHEQQIYCHEPIIVMDQKYITVLHAIIASKSCRRHVEKVVQNSYVWSVCNIGQTFLAGFYDIQKSYMSMQSLIIQRFYCALHITVCKSMYLNNTEICYRCSRPTVAIPAPAKHVARRHNASCYRLFQAFMN